MYSLFISVRVLWVALICAVSTSAVAKIKILPVPVGATAVQINTMISTAPAGAQLVFPKGEFVLKAPLLILRDNISLIGSGDQESNLRFVFPDGQGSDYIQIRGYGKEDLKPFTSSTEVGDSEVSLGQSSHLAPGDYVYFNQPNSHRYFAKNGWLNLPFDYALHRPFRESIHQIKSVSNETIVLKTPLPFIYPAHVSSWQKIHMRRGVILSNLTVSGGLGTSNPLSFENSFAEFNSTAALRAFQTAGLVLNNISFKDVASKAIALDSSYNAEVDQVHVSGSHNKGVGGNGYGIELRQTFQSRLTKLKIVDVRHAVLFSSWHAEIGNLVQVDFTNRDINFHGSPDHSNSIFVDCMKLTYDVQLRAGRPRHAWSAISFGGKRHARTNFFRGNKIELRFVVSGWRKDILPASALGSVLNGGGGDDTFFSNIGSDRFTGGPGQDTFVVGEGVDTIEDFKIGKDGDRLIVPASYVLSKTTTEETPEGMKLKFSPVDSVLLKGVNRMKLVFANIENCIKDCGSKAISNYLNTK